MQTHPRKLRYDTARYIAELANELENMARRAGLTGLAEGLLHVRDEANSLILESERPPSSQN
ncbi:MAG: hypothetical protein JWM36_3890 [Hyphomicrobiales bacterium]|nr:hypothetical protein [Hyphomicrobiales bacterium]